MVYIARVVGLVNPPATTNMQCDVIYGHIEVL
jgi:hypothetical protein